MGFEIGIIFAFGALMFWGVGDFFIQKTTRKLGDWETLFVVTLFGTIMLMPFVYQDIQQIITLQDNTFLLLIATSTVLFATALVDFEALKKGKISIVEPIIALEVPITAIITFALINEGIEAIQMILMSTLLLGIVMVSLKSHHLKKNIWIEKGALLAFVSSILFGLSNFLVGFSSRNTSPIFTNWFLNIFIAFICLFYLFSNKKLTKFCNDFNNNKKMTLITSFFDNAAWVCIAFAATFIPITIAFALSESYIAVAALLGLLINKEILMKHQKAGLVVALGSAIMLSMATI